MLFFGLCTSLINIHHVRKMQNLYNIFVQFQGCGSVITILHGPVDLRYRY